LIFHLREKLNQFGKHEVVYFGFIVVYIYATFLIILGLPDTVLDTIIIQIVPVYITVEGVLIGLSPQIKIKWLRDLVAFVGIASLLLSVRTLLVATYQHLQLSQSSLTGTTSGFVTTSLLFLVLVEVYAFALLIPISGKRDQKSKAPNSEQESKTDHTIVRIMDKKKPSEFVDLVNSDARIDVEDLRLILSSRFEAFTSLWIFGMGLVVSLLALIEVLPDTPTGQFSKIGLAIVVIILYAFMIRLRHPNERLDRIFKETDYLDAKEILIKRKAGKE
jgi:hypothetical protein